MLGRAIPAFFMAWGWEAAFAVFALFQAGLLAMVIYLFPRQALPVKKFVGLVRSAISNVEWISSLWPVLRWHIPVVAIGGFILMVTQVGVMTFVAAHLSTEPFHWSTWQLGTLYVVFLPALAAIRLTPGAIARFGPNKMLLFTFLANLCSLLAMVSEHEVLLSAALCFFSATIFIG